MFFRDTSNKNSTTQPLGSISALLCNSLQLRFSYHTKTVAPALYPSNQARNPAPTMGRQKRKKRDEAIKRKWELGEHARDGLAIPQREFVNRLISRYRMQRSEKY